MTLKLNGTNSEAAPAYAGDDADTGLQCGTNELKLVTGGTARATVDSTGIGIGTNSPNSFLHVDSDNTYGSVVLSRDGGVAGRRPFGIGISGSTDSNLRISASSDTSGANAFANQLIDITADGNVGIGVAPSSWGGSRNAIQFDSAGAAYICNDSTVGIVSNMYFDGSNNKYINAGTASTAYFQQDNVVFQFAPSGSANGNGTFTTSTRIDADGVKFGSDTAAANALDDYEEGDWTPASYQNFNGISNADGEYTKIGNYVTVQFQFNYSSLDSASQSSAISGLPFTVANVNPNTGVEATSIAFGTNKDVVLWAEGGTNRLYFRTGSPAVGSSSTGADFFRGSISYMV